MTSDWRVVEKQAVWCCSKCGAVYHKDFPRCPVNGAEVVLAMDDPLLGTSIGDYVVDELIGEGGMGRVYSAHHAHLPDKRSPPTRCRRRHRSSASRRPSRTACTRGSA